MPTEPDYGEAINLVTPDGRLRADMSGPMVTGVRALLMRVLARICSRTGSLFYSLSTGVRVPLYDLLNLTADNELQQIAGKYGAEAEREQGVLSAACIIVRDAIDPKRIRVSLTVNLTSRTAGLNLIVSPGQAALVLYSGVN
jgi:hypothetical protein